MSSATPANPMQPRKSFAQVAAAAHIPNIPKEKASNNASTTAIAAQSPPLINNATAPPRPPTISPTVDSEQQILAKDGEKDVAAARKLNGALLRTHGQEIIPPTLSSVESFSRRDNSDTKSVTSRTTLTLDEKESLRPDDSASVQAAVDDDRLSVSGSRLGTSNSEARAFSDQLHEIERSGAPRISSQRGLPIVAFPLEQRQNGGIIYTGSPAAVPYPQSGPASIDPSQFRTSQSNLALPPDEKLMDALASPKDRLFVLKVEQDIIDFVKDSKEQVLVLPQTNSFYRMLSHKLADYYCLDHAVDDSMQSVQISRTPHCRLPVSLISMSTGTDGPTPPPTAPTRKIMRRGQVGDGQFSGPGTENPSKTTSEIGAGSGGEEAAKDRSAMTREERESRYHEVRARIFKDFKEESPIEGEDLQNEALPSRASSPSKGKKQKKKKPRDDSFEPRSTFNAVSNQQYGTGNMQQHMPNMASMFNTFQNLNVTGAYQSPTTQQQIGSQFHDPSVPQQYMPPNSWYNGMQQYPVNYGMPPQIHQQAVYGQMMEGGHHGGYTPYNGYGSPNIGSQSTPKPGHPSLASYPPMYQQPSGQQMWSQMGFPAPYGQQAPPYHDPSSIPPSQVMYGFQPQQQGQYYDAQAWTAFQGQQFNPMSQSFIPSYGQQQVPARFSHPGQMQRQVSNTSGASGFGSPLHGSSRSVGQHSPNVLHPNTAGQQSTISKWANTTSLPSKPPPPKPESLPLSQNAMSAGRSS